MGVGKFGLCAVEVDPESTGAATRADRRKSARRTFFLRVEAKRVTPSRAGPFKLVSSNVSADGMMLHGFAETGVFLMEDDVLDLDVETHWETSRTRVGARIVWKKRVEKSILGDWAFGIAFLADGDAPSVRKIAGRASVAWLGI